MLPITPLMIEHRLIERMINIVKKELLQINQDEKKVPNLPLLKRAVDFIRFYADKTHHGKEEDILFRELKKKDIEGFYKQIMDELIDEHKYGRKITKNLSETLNEYESGNEEVLNTLKNLLNELADFYPKHIDKEDNHFFKPIMRYFSPEEQKYMLKEGQIFDRKMIHRKYLSLVEQYEKEYGLFDDECDDKWLNFI